MAIGQNVETLRQIRTLYRVGVIRDLTDGQLLERSSAGGDEAAELAFAALVERHGPMVLRVCQAVLRDEHAAQDAFQATFLVLVRKARSLWVRDSLGPWLHQVAYRTASCGRSAAARRRRLDRRAAELAPQPTAHGGEASDDLEAVLQEELGRLPERYRTPLVLCDLEGQTHEQAARILGWPVGTVKSRQSRGRERLRTRLIRRGLAPVAGLGSVLSAGVTHAGIPTALVKSTASFVTGFAAGRVATGVIPAAVGRLAEGTMMTMTHLKYWALAMTLLAVAVTFSACLLADDTRVKGAAAVSQDREVTPHASRRPSPLYVGRLDLGVIHVGAVGEGGVNVKFQGIGGGKLAATVEAPDFLTVKSFRVAREGEDRPGVVGLSVALAVDTKSAGRRSGDVTVRLGDQVARLPVAASVVPRITGMAKVLVISSGFDSDSNATNPHRQWFDLVNEARLDVSYMDGTGLIFEEWEPGPDHLPLLSERLARYDVILLTGSGMVHLNDVAIRMLRQFVESGKRLVVTASPFFIGSVPHANQVLEPYGMAMSSEEVRVGEGSRPIEAAGIMEDPLTAGVKALTTHRPAAVRILDPEKAKILALLPERGDGFVAVYRRGKGEVVAVGLTLISSWLGTDGKQADNACLLRNLLTPGTGK